MQVTAILYANPGWTPADGGKLRLWPPRMIDPASATLAPLQSGPTAAGEALRFDSMTHHYCACTWKNLLVLKEVCSQIIAISANIKGSKRLWLSTCGPQIMICSGARI